MTEEKHRLTDFKEFSIKQLLELGNLSGLTKTFKDSTKAMGLEHADEGYERMLEVRIPIVSAITKYTESGKTKIVLTDQLAGGEWFE